jgi:hypothetical protein
MEAKTCCELAGFNCDQGRTCPLRKRRPESWWLLPALLGGIAGWVALGRGVAIWMGWW